MKCEDCRKDLPVKGEDMHLCSGGESLLCHGCWMDKRRELPALDLLLMEYPDRLEEFDGG